MPAVLLDGLALPLGTNLLSLFEILAKATKLIVFGPDHVDEISQQPIGSAL